MGKKDKRRKRMKNFVQNKQRQEKVKKDRALSVIKDKNNKNNNDNSRVNITTPEIPTIVHHITTTSTSHDENTTTESTPLSTVSDTYQSIMPVNGTTHNSSPLPLPRSSSPHIEVSTQSNDTASLLSLSAQQQRVPKTSDAPPHSPSLLPASYGSVAPMDSTNSEIPNINSVPELNLNDQEETGDISNKSIRSAYLLTPMRKWFSISVIYLLSILIGFDLGKTWIYQSEISSKFNQLYNTSQLLTFVVLGYWLQSYLRFDLSIRNNIMIISILEMLSFFTLNRAPCFSLVLISRLLTGILTGLFSKETLTFFENIGNIRYKVPFHVYVGILCATFFDSLMWNWLFYGASCLTVAASFIILPNIKSQVEISSYLINKGGLFIVLGYIFIQFFLIFIHYSYKFIFTFLIVISLYVYTDHKSKSRGMISSSSNSSISLLFSKYCQDKLNISLRIVTLLLGTIIFYSLSIYLDIFHENYDRVYCLLFGVLFGLLLLDHISYSVALFIFVVTILDIIVTGIDDLNLFIKLLLVVAVGCFVIISTNIKPLQRDIPNNYIFEAIVILSGMIIADALTHIYTKKLIFDGLMELESKKHPYSEIIKILKHSDESIKWIHSKTPKFALRIINSSYKKSFTIIWMIAGILSIITFVLNIVAKYLE